MKAVESRLAALADEKHTGKAAEKHTGKTAGNQGAFDGSSDALKLKFATISAVVLEAVHEFASIVGQEDGLDLTLNAESGGVDIRWASMPLADIPLEYLAENSELDCLDHEIDQYIDSILGKKPETWVPDVKPLPA